MPDTSAGSVAAAVAVAAAAAGGPSLPGSANPLPSGAPDTRRASTGDKGMPYYEKIRKDLRDMLQRKKLLDRNLAVLEDQIAKFEATYLDETPNGNIIRGFDNYIKGTAARRRNAIGDADRVFSMSSATSLKAAQQESETTSSQSQSASASTPSINQTDQKPPLLKKKTIKRRKGEDGSESPSDVETPGPKRVRISFSRQPT
ncbi:histone acetyltransferase subunit NuA4-domain-containing protein [Terfezia claveryi]|nr:histone acetyltransferase subunit NuA4-domain-containing protein [Terfezia claveryi]